MTESYRPFRAGDGVLFTFGDPVEVLWFAQGRTATREEVEASIESGLPLLTAQAEAEGLDAVAALRRKTADAMRWLPAANGRDHHTPR